MSVEGVPTILLAPVVLVAVLLLSPVGRSVLPLRWLEEDPSRSRFVTMILLIVGLIAAIVLAVEAIVEAEQALRGELIRRGR